MANKPFEYRIINQLERPKSEDINLAQEQAHADARLVAREMFEAQDGFLGNGFLVGVSPIDPTEYVRITSGVFFQTKDAEYSIGGVAGLNDALPYKATTIGDLEIGCQPPPTGVDEKRYDLIQVRPLTGIERLIDPETVDILNPSLQTFSQSTLPKTLTASFTPGVLAGLLPVYTNIDVPVTEPMSYVTGAVATTTDWGDVLKPGIVPGYMGVVYIKRYSGQTEITAADIEDARTLLKLPVGVGGTGTTNLPAGAVLLGNGTSSITSTAILPISKGGTGNSAAAGYTGSLVWYNAAENKFDYAQAYEGAPIYSAMSGYLLSSNATGAPTWVAPGTTGQVLVSTGTAWAAQDGFRYYYSLPVTVAPGSSATYSELSDFTLTNKELVRGLARFKLQPAENGFDSSIQATRPDSSFDGVVYIKIEITGPTPREFVFKTWMGAATDPALRTTVAFPALEDFFEAGNYTVKVYYKTEAATMVFTNCVLFVSQG